MLWKSKLRNSGIPGALLKVFDEDTMRYYKASTFMYGVGFVGTESINEVIVSKLCDMLDIPHIEYFLSKEIIDTEYGEYETYVCYSYDYKCGKSTIAYEDANFKLPDIFKYKMFLLDFIIINWDRHGANIEFYEDGTPVPLFDNGLSLLAPYLDNVSNINKMDVRADFRTNNYIGSKNLYENLKSVPKGVLHVPDLNKQLLYDFLRELPLKREQTDKIYEIITVRYDIAMEVIQW